MEAEYYKKYEPFFGGWYIKALLGEGGYGKVFQIERRDTFGTVFESALKVITIPPNKSGIEDAMADGMDQNSAAIYFQDCVKELNREIVLMSRLKGHSNIVSYEDHSIIQHEDGIGWDILIRMELLTPITRFLKDNRFFSRRRVVQMGIDLCRALELCQKYDIIHRDIKPANIFLSEAGDFKLGDFGVARVTSAATAAYTRVGTMNYMAPEVFAGKEYSRNVDIYSLGLVMYQLLNGNRMPFYPPYPQPITFAEQERAHARRLGGEKLPAPANAPEKLAKIVLKACAPDPAKRYSDPAQMRRELEAVLPMFKETAQETVQPPMSDSTTLPLQQPVSMARDEMTTAWSQSGTAPAQSTAAQTQKPHSTASRPAAVPVPVKKQGGAKLPILLGTAAVVAVVAVAGGLALTTGSSGHALPTAEPAEVVTSSSEAASKELPASSEEADSAASASTAAASEAENGLLTAQQAQALLDDPRMVLVNRTNKMPDDYTFTTKECGSSTAINKTLQTEAADAFLAMQAAAAKDGVTIWMQSGYRSVEYQENLYNKKTQYYRNKGLSEADARQQAATIVDPPGYSEHNCGLAADLNSPEYTTLDEGFENTEAFRWLCAHAVEYGFILRYPKDAELVTEITYEPWHWRYVGPENAALIDQSGLCLEDIVAVLRQAVERQSITG